MFKILVPISGGKDSQSCLKLAVTIHGARNVRGLFCDTKFEHPLTYQHVNRLRTMYGNVQIDTVNGGDVLGKSIKYGRFPGSGSRHCTDELKIRETRIYLRKMALENGPFEVWYGMRSSESSERNKRYMGKVSTELYKPHEVMPSKYPQYLGKMGVTFRLAVIDWTDQDIYEYLEGELNPLYAAGFDRVGCFPCLAAGDATKRKAFEHDDFGREQYQRVLFVKNQIGKDVFTTPGEKYRTRDDGPGCMICSY